MDNNNDGNRSLLLGLLDPSHNCNGRPALKRRYRRCRSAPVVDYVPLEGSTDQSIQHSQFLFGNLHPSFTKVCAYLSIYLGVGVTCVYIIRYQIEGKKTKAIVDALYFCIVTMTTVGYGDLAPNSVLAKLLACAFVFSGMALVGVILSKGADYLVEKQESLLVRALSMRQKLGPGDIMKEIEMKKVRYKCFTVLAFLLVLVTIGTIFLVLVEKKDVVDAFYCVCCTITTLGYGDQSFSTEGGRVFAVFWILTSTICMAQFFLYVAELNTERRQRALVKWVLTRRVTNVDLEVADMDNDGVVDATEFILYKLREMGKITQEDISLVLKEFEELDVDQSGTLSLSDITLAQSTPRPR
ncbi:hypothetical protein Nepgr_007644 [Nepenthes gracilis]|uniref:Potassium channel domain-containing protein n=1 Tax=Nepenthes gracilis TaxID=150966 RepID=A0AAD3XII8_NEPGR|nr:hypothetical protein Nepgr_007644 [Nepenthes gracilis]